MTRTNKTSGPADGAAVSLDEPLLDCEAAAALLNVRVSWVRDAARLGHLPCLRVGRHLRFTRVMLEDWLAEQVAVSSTPARAYPRPVNGSGSTDFLQTVTLLATYEIRRCWDERAASLNGDDDARGPAVSCKRRDVLRLTLDDYKRWRDVAIRGYEDAGRLLVSQFFFTPKDLPYRTQLVPLAAIFAVLGQKAEAEGVRLQLRRWFWSGVFGELYGSATETRFAKDLPEVVQWVGGAAEPDTVSQASFAPGRLHTMRSRQSAAYKGLYALLMRDGAKDFRTGDTIQLATYFNDEVDIHHIFPQGWFKDLGLSNPLMDSVVNKTPLSKRTNIQVGKKAPSVYLAAIEDRDGIDAEALDAILMTHVIDPTILRCDDFERFYEARFEQLLQRIESAIGKQIAREPSESTVSAGEATIDFEGAAAPAEHELSPAEVETMEEELTTVG